MAKKTTMKKPAKKAVVKKAPAKRRPISVKPESTIPGPMNFGAAIAAAKMGKKIARAGWNGKGMFVIWVPGQKKVPLKAGTPYANAFPKRKFIDIDGHLDMFTAGKTMQPGWLASQADIAATDWVIVK